VKLSTLKGVEGREGMLLLPDCDDSAYVVPIGYFGTFLRTVNYGEKRNFPFVWA